jgi:hypothetical protein
MSGSSCQQATALTHAKLLQMWPSLLLGTEDKSTRDQIVPLEEEADRLAQPPSGFGVFLNIKGPELLRNYVSRAAHPARLPNVRGKRLAGPCL